MSEPKYRSYDELDDQTKEHIRMFKAGSEVWNKWANEMLARKEELEKAGKWKVTEGFDTQGRYRTMSADHSTPEIQARLDEAYVDFSNILFQTEHSSDLQEVGEDKAKKNDHSVKSITVSGDEINFTEFIFPSKADFGGAEFQGDAYFWDAKFQGEAVFRDAKFQGRAAFNRAKFQVRAVFRDAEFQGDAYFGDPSFDGAEFQGEASFNRAKFQVRADFGGAKFQVRAYFGETEFQGEAAFNRAKFQVRADFGGAKFQGWADFNRAEFQGWAGFSDAEFQGWADFSDAEFQGGAVFRDAEFQGEAAFNRAEFQEGADFGLVDFERHVSFSKAEVKKQANFEAILVKRAFSLADAEFTTKIPNYTQANFAESPRLDNIEIIPSPQFEDYPFPSEKIQSPLKWQRYWWNLQYRAYLMRLFWRCVYKLTPSNYRKLYHKGEVLKHIWNKFTNTRRDKNEEAHYRALKRLAIQAHDHENEMKFFAGEIRARRHITDFANFLTHDFASSMRYWAGVAYELFSDFGRSFIRPTLWWFACLWLFANLTLSDPEVKNRLSSFEKEEQCPNSILSPDQAAYTIGLKNSLLILGLTKTNIVKQAELCLYGLNKNGTNKNGDAENKPKTYNPKIKRNYRDKQRPADTTKTDIPFKAAVQGIAHSLLSLLFIFLLLLAIRNQFKIK